MEHGDAYFVNDQGVISVLPSASCSEGDSITPQNVTVKQSRFINGHLISGRNYTYTSYNTDSFTCHIYDGSIDFNPESMILPATLIMLAFFSIIYHWFLRLRG